MDRRNFIKAAGLASGAIFLSNRLSGTTLNPTENPHKPVLHNGVLNGVCDLHIHAAPDIKERTVNELELCRTAKETGYKAVMFKSNVWSCHDRAYIVRQALPGFACFGSLVMNLAFGERVNIHTAKQALNTSGNLCRCIWMPTQDASYPPLAEAGHTGNHTGCRHCRKNITGSSAGDGVMRRGRHHFRYRTFLA